MKKHNAKALEKIFFPVRKESEINLLSPEHENLQFAPSVSHCIIVDTPSGPLKVANCGQGYHLVDNKELMTPLIEEIETLGDIQLKVKMYDYAKFYVDVIFKGTSFAPVKKDEVHPRIRINNSYDGSVKYSLTGGFYRQVCSNGLVAPIEGTQKQIKTMHTPIAGPMGIEDSMNFVQDFVKQAPELSKKFKALVDKKIPSIAEAQEIMKNVVEDTNYPKKTVEAAVNRLQIEMDMGFGLNNYLVYNALNHALYHNEDSAMKEHKRDKADLEVFKKLLK